MDGIKQETNAVSFYQNIWFWIAIALLLVVLGIGIRVQIYSNNATPKDVQEEPRGTIIEATIEQQNTAQQIGTKDLKIRRSEGSEKALARGWAVIAESGQYYPTDKYVLLKDKDVGIRIDDFDYAVEIASRETTTYLLVINYSVTNNFSGIFSWGYDSFVLKDNFGYTYKISKRPFLMPDMKQIWQGQITQGKNQKGKVAFEVTVNYPHRVDSPVWLSFTTKGEPSEIGFKIDIHSKDPTGWDKYYGD